MFGIDGERRLGGVELLLERNVESREGREEKAREREYNGRKDNEKE